MVKHCALFFNTNKLGGAERSIIVLMQHCKNLGTRKFSCYYPELQGAPDLVVGEGSSLIAFPYPQDLYSISRRPGKKKVAYFTILKCVLKLRNYLSTFNFCRYDELWFNGNKVAYPVLLFLALKNLFSSQKSMTKIFWFWRDYPVRNFALRYLYLFFQSNLSLTCVANSQDVAKALKKLYGDQGVEVIYPLPDEIFKARSIEAIKQIGVPAMLAPWKGLLEVLIMVAEYQKALKDLGIEKIRFYGDQIYQTEGEHSNYKNLLLDYIKDHKLDIVSFEGKQSPSTIMKQSDLIIHSSLSPEPFGRVIIEAFMAKVPVISTALGGAGETVRNGETGLVFTPYSSLELFMAIEKMIQNPCLRSRLQESSFEEFQKISKWNKDLSQKLFS